MAVLAVLAVLDQMEYPTGDQGGAGGKGGNGANGGAGGSGGAGGNGVRYAIAVQGGSYIAHYNYFCLLLQLTQALVAARFPLPLLQQIIFADVLTQI